MHVVKDSIKVPADYWQSISQLNILKLQNLPME